MPEPSRFNTDRTYPGRWTITFSASSFQTVGATRRLRNAGALLCLMLG
jgi:hypothetical protein